VRDPQAEISVWWNCESKRRQAPSPHRPSAKPFLHLRQLVMRRDNARFPLHVAGAECLRHRVAFQQQAQPRQFAQIGRGEGRDLEAALALGDDQPLRRQPTERLAQRADGRAVVVAQPLERSFCPGASAPRRMSARIRR
jgi:hypothetical protein